MKLVTLGALVLSASLLASIASADGSHTSVDANQPLRADGHAPIGVMGDHRHGKGEFMLSYRYMRMDMSGSRIGNNSVSNDAIATGVANSFFGMPMQPPTLRVVPTDMTMDMHMFGAMYAPSDNLTLMAMVPYLEKSMNHQTYAGPAGTTVLGGFNTGSEGIGDVKVAGLIKLMERGNHKLHFNMGLSLPTGSITETGQILTPMNTRPTVRLPYAMQLGSGTYDLLPGLTYSGRSGKMGYGGQLRGIIRLDKNDEGYALGDEAALSLWASYQPEPWISLSGRIEAKTADHISGRDVLIRGPVQTADPLNFGGQTVTLFAGVNMIGQKGGLRGHRLSIEAGLPIYQDLNGPQLETDWTLSVGWQKAF